MKYVQIPEEVFKNLKLSQEHILTEEDVVKINIHKKILAKLVRQKALSIQFDIWAWRFKNLDLWLWLVKELEKVAQDIEQIEQIFAKQQEMKEAEEKKEVL